MTSQNNNNSVLINNFRYRSRILFAMETYFQLRNYISIHTPAMLKEVIPERHINVFSVEEDISERKYLMPSPEFGLKTLLAEIFSHNTDDITGKKNTITLPDIYEISHSFRKSEVLDAIHNREFIMLEWYTNGASLEDSLQTCNELLSHTVEELAHAIANKNIVGILNDIPNMPVWTNNIKNPYIYRMDEAFRMFANIDLEAMMNCETGLAAAEFVGLIKSSHDILRWHTYDWEDVFHCLLVDRIEPNLPKDRPVYLTHYPVHIETLSHSKDGKWAERWELYIQGIEIANCYVEETNQKKIADFMYSQHKKIQSGQNIRSSGIPYPTQFLQHTQLPPYSGVALGFDRLVMCMLGSLVDATAGTNSTLCDISPLAYLQD